MYAKCGALSRAQLVLEQLPLRNVVTWSALIAGYAKQGQGNEALKCFDDMLHEGHSPDVVTFVCVLKACGSIGAADKGQEIHDKIVSLGMLEKHIALGNALVDMYAKCGALAKAHCVLKELPTRNVVTWSSLIAGHVQQGHEEEALKCFDDMLHEGHCPNAVTFTCVLKACGSLRATAKGEQIHDKIVHLGMLEKDIILGNSLVDMYAKCGALGKAQQVLKELPLRNVVTWSALIAGYVQHMQGEQALNCFDDMLREGHFPHAATLVCVLKACGIIRAAVKGEEIHDNVVSLGMLEKDVVLGNALVDMYVKCGELSKARQVLEELPLRDVTTWSTLIVGYVQQEQGDEALKCFDDMLCEGHSPDAVVFVCALKACGNMRAVDKGEQIHDKIVSLGMLEKASALNNALVEMYAKCGALFKAQLLLEELPIRDVVSWNAVIDGHAQQEQGEEALKFFDAMMLEGCSPNVVTFACALKACGSIGEATKGEKIHDKILNLGMLENDIVLGSTLVDMYAKCGVPAKAQQVLKELPVRNIVTWNALIAGYVQQGQGEEALKCFDDMLCEGHFPVTVTFICALKACGSIGATAKVKEIHDKIVMLSMLEKDIVLGNTLLDTYVKCGALDKAQRVLEELPIRNVVSWNSLIAGYAQQGEGEKALKCFSDMLHEGYFPDAVTFACMLKVCGSIRVAAKGEVVYDKLVSLGMLEKNVLLENTLVDIYREFSTLAKLGGLEKLPTWDLVAWNTLFNGYALHGQEEELLRYFNDISHEGHSLNLLTLFGGLKASGSIRASTRNEDISCSLVSLGLLEKDIVLGNTLVDMYARCGALAKAQQILEELPVRNVVSWSALIAGYIQHGQGKEALKSFDDMLHEGHFPDVVTFVCALKACGSVGAASKGEEIHDRIVSLGMLEKDIVLGNMLVDMYTKCGALAKAQRVFQALPVRDVATWNSLIAGYAEQGQGEEALKCFDDMLHEGHSPSVVTFTCALKACGSIGAVAKSKEIHDKILSLSMEKDVVLGNTLVDMYVKCGAVSRAQGVLEELTVQNVITWSTVIAGYAKQGQPLESISCFESMQLIGVEPSSITLTSLLNACNHSGLLDQAESYFSQMRTKYGIHPNLEHYCCMADLFSRAGEFNKALSMIAEMPSDACFTSWLALLGSCFKWGDVKIAGLVFERALHLDKRNVAIYVLMVDIYTSTGMQEETDKIELMRVANSA